MLSPPVWNALLILIVCPILGGLPLIDWLVRLLARKRLGELGTGNISVSAAFYHGGTSVGIAAVASEALKGIAAVLLARNLFPETPAWEIVALIALVLGRYGMARGAGTTNVVWGYLWHDWVSASSIFLIGGISFTVLRERRLGKFGVLFLMALVTALRHPREPGLVGTTIALAGVMAWIYAQIPDDLDLSSCGATAEARQVFRFFRGDRAILSLDQPLKKDQVGEKAAMLAQLKQWGYAVPPGWVLPPGDDPAPLIEWLQPTPEQPLVVRSSAIGEDSERASAAGQYVSILNVTSKADLAQAILECQVSYNAPHAVQYRQARGLAERGMAVVVQQQVKAVFSGVAFSRDPVHRQGEEVVVEGLAGMASSVVSGRVTPEQYRVHWQGGPEEQTAEFVPPGEIVEGEGDLPPALVKGVAGVARSLEQRFHGVPQDIEWSDDGQTLWILQARPITTLQPIWTRKIAAEVIPGFIRPLTWSINRPLTCGVWGDLFTVVLGKRASGLDFESTATLHHSAAYFNATLLGEIFLRMGLPPESLEFLTQGAKFTKPPLTSTLRNVPGLLRLARLELRLDRDFEQDWQRLFQPGLLDLASRSPIELSPDAILSRIDQILSLLKRATYYSILAPLSLALRRSLLRVNETDLDNSQMPEVASIRSLQTLVAQAQAKIPNLSRFEDLSQTSEGRLILQDFDRFLEEFGYLSEVATDIAVPTWRDDPRPLQALFDQFLQTTQTVAQPRSQAPVNKANLRVQKRLDLKGRVTTVYSRLLAELRWSFLALGQHWLQTETLSEAEDIFFLTFAEIEQQLQTITPVDLSQRIANRRSQFEQDRQTHPPLLVYGNDPPPPELSTRSAVQRLQGIGASPGQVEGQVLVLKTLQEAVGAIDRQTILVVPYTDSGWSPLLAQAGGIVAEVGGQLSHGAIIAREYGIPAVMNVTQATRVLQSGQWIRVDGERGRVEILQSR